MPPSEAEILCEVARVEIFDEISAERRYQIEKWGADHQTHPHAAADGARLQYWRYCQGLAKGFCDRLTQETVSWEDILYEEMCEAFSEDDWDSRRKELIQAAAVIVAEIEDGDVKAATRNPGAVSAMLRLNPSNDST